MEIIGKHFLPWRVKQALKNNKSLRDNIGFNKAKQIGIIFSSKSKAKNDAIQKYTEELRESGKDVTVLAFVSKNADIPPGHIDHFSQNELTITGVIRNEKALKFTEKTFDYLVCLDTQADLYVKNILAMSKAKFRLGTYVDDESEDYFEMMIKLKHDSNFDHLIEEIKTFTNKLAVNGI
jgi:hypothetical protein